VLLWNLIQVSESILFLFLYLGFRTFLNFRAELSVQRAVEIKLQNFLLPLNPIGARLESDYNIPPKSGNAGSLQKVVINQHLAVFARLRAVINERTS